MTLATARKQGGFTLLELLIVIVIIGILALLILPNLTSAPKKARDTKRKTDIIAVEKGLEEYFLSNNAYPDSVTAGLTALTGGSAPILKSIPSDPKNVAPYVYIYVTANADTTYTLSACLENSQESGTDVVLPAVSNNTACPTKVFQVVNG
jgi:type II secretion system protein G